MNILLINHYAGSIHHGMEYRPYYFAREWQKLGHNVTIVASSESHVRSKCPVLKGLYDESIIDGIMYLWLNTPAYEGNGLRRAINMAAFVSRMYQFHRRILARSKPHLVIASSTYPADIFPAKFIARKAGARLIYEVHDLWPLSPMELGGMSRLHPFIVLMQAAEDYAYRYSDAVVSMLPKTQEHMLSRGLTADKWSYVPNGICLDDWKNIHPLPESVVESIRQEKAKGNFLVAYCGAHGLANSLNTLIDAAAELKTEAVSFFLVGKGPEKAKLMELAKSKRLQNVIFFDHVDKASMPELLSMFDALFIGLQKQSLFRFGISPNKLIDYMMAGKPIIQAIEAGNDMVAEAGCGLSIAAENSGAIVDAVKKLSGMDLRAREQLGEAGKKYVIMHHDYKNLADKFMQIMSSL